MMAKILELPPELMTSIIDQIRDFPALRCLARTCAAFRLIPEACMWKHVHLEDSSKVGGICGALQARSNRQDVVRSIVLIYQPGHLQGYSSILDQTRNLKHLTLEPPPPTASRILVNLEQNVLSNMLCCVGRPPRRLHDHFSSLTTLAVNWRGRGIRHWKMDPDLAEMFTLPHLHHLTLTCAVISQDALDRLPATPLITLVLAQCGVDPGAMHMILSLPKALRRIEIGLVSLVRLYQDLVP